MLLQQTTLAGPSHLRTSPSIKFIRRGSEGGESGGGENLWCQSEKLFKIEKDLSLTRLSWTEKPQNAALSN